jgi:uncharacterized membrane protein
MKHSRSKLLLLILLLSLAVNLFLVGGIVYRVAFQPEFGPRPLPRNVSWIVRDLSQDRQQELQPLLESNRQESESLRREMFNAQRRINELMASSNFDSEELNLAFTQLRNSGNDYQAMSHQQTVDILSRLTEDERKLAQEFLQRRGPRSGNSERGPRPPKPPERD